MSPDTPKQDALDQLEDRVWEFAGTRDIEKLTPPQVEMLIAIREFKMVAQIKTQITLAAVLCVDMMVRKAIEAGQESIVLQEAA